MLLAAAICVLARLALTDAWFCMPTWCLSWSWSWLLGRSLMHLVRVKLRDTWHFTHIIDILTCLPRLTAFWPLNHLLFWTAGGINIVELNSVRNLTYWLQLLTHHLGNQLWILLNWVEITACRVYKPNNLLEILIVLLVKRVLSFIFYMFGLSLGSITLISVNLDSHFIIFKTFCF